MQEIQTHKQHKSASLHVLGDFNFRLIDWQSKSNKLSGNSLSDCEGQLLIDILNHHSAEQLVSFPTRNENTLDLLITTSPNQYANVCSQDSISDHEILSANFHYHKPPSKQPKRKYLQYAKGDYESMRQDAKLFTKERYFNGYQDKRSVNQNWCMIKDFIV